jgi:Rod binding domain-containing protein
MEFPAAPALKPLDLARTARAPVRPVVPGDLSHASRLAGPTPTQHDRIAAQAEKWVAQTFFGTLLKQMENSPFKSDLFSGGRGGQAFSSLYHQQLTERMAHSVGNKLVKTIVRKIEATAAYQKQQSATENGTIPPAAPVEFGGGPRSNAGQPNRRRDVAAAARA